MEAVNIRDFTRDKHKKVDDYPYGGGAGMVMQAEPIYLAYQHIEQKMEKKPRVIYVTPQGKVFHQEMAKELAEEEELPAMVMIDAISRLVPGVLNNGDSAEYESFENGMLEYPQYTRPPEFLGRKVPEVLLSGHHGRIEEWRKEQSYLRTKERRPDLLDKNK